MQTIKGMMTLPTYLGGNSAAKVWPRPPLITGITIGEINLDDYTRIIPQMENDELAAVIEEFTELFIAKHGSEKRLPAAWLRDRLNIPRDAKEWLLPTQARDGVADDVFWCYAVLLWLVGNAGNKFEFNETHIVVEVAGYKLGIVDGQSLAIFPANRVKVHTPNWEDLLTQPLETASGVTRNAALNRIYREAEIHPETVAIRMALRTLFWRTKDAKALAAAFYGKLPVRGEANPYQIRRLCRNILTSKNPYKYMYDRLIPSHMGSDTFASLFGEETADAPNFGDRVEWGHKLVKHFNL